MEQSRLWRALALRHGLDPDKTPVEDILLLEEDDKGNLKVAEKAKRAAAAVDYVNNHHQQTGDSLPGK